MKFARRSLDSVALATLAVAGLGLAALGGEPGVVRISDASGRPAATVRGQSPAGSGALHRSYGAPAHRPASSDKPWLNFSPFGREEARPAPMSRVGYVVPSHEPHHVAGQGHVAQGGVIHEGHAYGGEIHGGQVYGSEMHGGHPYEVHPYDTYGDGGYPHGGCVEGPIHGDVHGEWVGGECAPCHASCCDCECGCTGNKLLDAPANLVCGCIICPLFAKLACCLGGDDCHDGGFDDGDGDGFGGREDYIYPADPNYFDRRDGQVYSVQGYGIPMAVPLAPTVQHTYNYSWGVPSSRITPISRPVVGY